MTPIKQCPRCGVKRKFRTENETVTHDVRGIRVELPVTREVCTTCGTALAERAGDAALLARAHAEYRRQRGLLFPHEIKAIRARYALSQKAFAALLGMSEATINRYEQGGLQEETHDNMIRLAAAPEALAELLHRRGHLLSDRQRQRARQALQRAVPRRPGARQLAPAVNPRRLPPVTARRLAPFCRRWRIVQLALFGSVLRDDFTESSDVDVLVRFSPDAEWNFEHLDAMRRELEMQFQRPVDLVDQAVLERSRNHLRRRAILESARVIYAA